jgi:hypothetical protein
MNAKQKDKIKNTKKVLIRRLVASFMFGQPLGTLFSGNRTSFAWSEKLLTLQLQPKASSE